MNEAQPIIQQPPAPTDGPPSSSQKRLMIVGAFFFLLAIGSIVYYIATKPSLPQTPPSVIQSISPSIQTSQEKELEEIAIDPLDEEFKSLEEELSQL